MQYSATWYFRIGLLGLVVLMAGCTQRTSEPDKVEAPAVIAMMNKKGIIAHPTEWDAAMKRTDNGKKIKTVQELSHVLQEGNPHSFATDSPQQLEQIHYPTISKVKGIQIVNVPTFFSAHRQKAKKYQRRLQAALKTVSQQKTIVLNFAHNEGGDYYPMLTGLSAVIPRGIIWSEVDKTGHAKQVKMTDEKIVGGLDDYTYRYSASHQHIKHKIMVIMDSRTGSAAEMTLMALKRNPQVTTIGVPSAGYTSVNTGRVAKSKKSAAILTVGTIDSQVKIGGQRHFNNQPLKPDITTMYPPISAAKGVQYKKQQPLDPDFWTDFMKQLPK